VNAHPAIFVSVALAAFVACAQGSTLSGTVDQNGFRGSSHFSAPRFAIRPITGAPYSGERTSEVDQTLADGTHIRNSTVDSKIYRDSEGRTRTERPLFPRMRRSEPEGPEAPILVEINDPVAHARYILDPVNMVAHRQQLPAADPGRPAAGTTDGGGVGRPATAVSGTALGVSPARGRQIKPETTSEKLGSQVMDGVEVEGTRRTTTWPVGARGNDRPITAVDESWWSPELKVMVLSRRSDPVTGEHTSNLINISRSEPDAALFQPPPDYSVVDEAGDFTITWTLQHQ
jgi:hypothetical protein